MSRSSTKSKMKVIPGGKQLSFIRDTEEVLKFLNYTACSSSLDPSEIKARIQACEICFKKISEEQDHVSWILANLDSILKDETAETREKVTQALEDYQFWSSDPFGWERHHEEKPVSAPVEPPKAKTKSTERILTFPINKNQCVEVKIPENGMSSEEFLRLGLFLYPYCNDLDLTKTFSWVRPPEKN